MRADLLASLVIGLALAVVVGVAIVLGPVQAFVSAVGVGGAVVALRGRGRR